MLEVLAALLFHWNAYIEPEYLASITPPPGYEYAGDYTEHPWRLLACGNRPGCSTNFQATGCRLYLWAGLTEEAREVFIEHELAHCAGWPRSHPGMGER